MGLNQDVSLEGVSVAAYGNSALCRVDFLSDELCDLIRRNLSSICHGANEAATGRAMYCYEQTIGLFLDGYIQKPSHIKVGMVGELLAHVLILHFFTDFEVASPFFNLEERSIKKGFDVILYSSSTSEVWITEVKSGHLNSGKDSSQTAQILLGRAARDLHGRLNEQDVNLWRNAVNSARIAVLDSADYKDAVINILRDEGDLVGDEGASSEDNNVFLVATLFADVQDPILDNVPRDFYRSLSAENKFRDEVVLCIQKSTLEAVVEFLRREADYG